MMNNAINYKQAQKLQKQMEKKGKPSLLRQNLLANLPKASWSQLLQVIKKSSKSTSKKPLSTQKT